MKMKIVVLKHMFSPREAQQCPEGEAAFYTELKVEVRSHVLRRVICEQVNIYIDTFPCNHIVVRALFACVSIDMKECRPMCTRE